MAPVAVAPAPKPARQPKAAPAATVGITLRPGARLLNRYTLAAADRTREEGRVISAQQIMLEVLERHAPEGRPMKAVAVLGDKGGTTKTASTHLLCLGAYLHGIPAAYVLTDPTRKVRGEGRPYAVLDGRLPEQLALIFDSSRSNLNGWLFIDGGGNRPDFDVEVARNCDLPVIPFRASEEDIDTVARSLTAIPNALAWPVCVADQYFCRQRCAVFAGRSRQGISAAHHPSADSVREFHLGLAVGKPGISFNGCAPNVPQSLRDPAGIFRSPCFAQRRTGSAQRLIEAFAPVAPIFRRQFLRLPSPAIAAEIDARRTVASARRAMPTSASSS